MSGRMVEYIVSLVDRFSANADKVASSSQKAAAAANNMGSAVNRAEAALARIKPPPALAGLPGQFDRAAAGATKMAAAVNSANAAVTKSNTVIAGGGSGSSGGSRTAALTDKAGKGLMAWLAGDAALHSIDHLISKAAEVDTLLEKLRYAVGGDKAVVKRAYDAAFKMSGKYKNTTIAENLHIIDDLRANLPHSMDKIIKEDFEPFVKLHSFFKSWEGGKHSGNLKGSMKDISTAIRSGELMGHASGDDIAKHAQALATGRVVFGDKFDVGKYFAAQRAGAAAIAGADGTFQNIDFNVLTQRLGQGAGVGLGTLHSKLVGGIMMRQASAEAWRKLGLVDMSKVKLDKGGFIDPKSIVGSDWLKGGAEWGLNPTDALMTMLAPALGKVKGLEVLSGMKDAWTRGDLDKLVEINKKVDRNKLAKQLAGLGYDRTAVRQIEETLLGAAGMMRSREAWDKVLKDFNNFRSYDQAKQAFSAQTDRLFQALTGRDFAPWVTHQINSVASAIGRLANVVNNNPMAKFAINTGGMATAIYMVGRLVSLMTGLKGIGPIGAALFIGSEVLANWDKVSATWKKLKEAFAEPLKIDMIFPELPDWLKSFIKSGHEANRAALEGRMPGEDSIFNWVRTRGPAETIGVGPDYSRAGYFDMLHKGGVAGAGADGPGDRRYGIGFGLGAGLAAVRQEVHVTTTLSPIQITAPPSITLNVTGTINGTVSGSGTVPLSASAPRGSTSATTVPGPPP